MRVFPNVDLHLLDCNVSTDKFMNLHALAFAALLVQIPETCHSSLGPVAKMRVNKHFGYQ